MTDRGFPKSRLQMQIESQVTPTSPPVSHSPMQTRCRNNLSSEFQRLGDDARFSRNNLSNPSTDKRGAGNLTGPQPYENKFDIQSFKDILSFDPSQGHHQQGEKTNEWEGKEEKTVSSCEGPGRETVTSNPKNVSMLCSDRSGQELREQSLFHAGYTPIPMISPSRPSDAWWMNGGSVLCLGCNNWGYIHTPPAVYTY